MPAIGGEGKVPGPIGDIERTPYQFTPRCGVLRPRRQGAEGNVSSRLVAREVALFDEIIAQLAKSEAVFVVVEARPGEHPEPDITEARGIAVAVLQAEIHHA